jgi:hypothetical protein
VDSGSKNACSTRCVSKTSLTTWAECVDGPGQHVALEAPDRVIFRRERRLGVGERDVDVVGDTNQVCGVPRGLLGLGDHDGQHVAQIAGAPSDRNEHRPVGVDQTDRELSGDVVAGEDRHDTIERLRIGRVDVEHVGSGVVGEPERTVQHPGDPQVVDEITVAEREFGSFVLDATGADAAGRLQFGDLLPGRQQLDRLDDLGVAGAATEVGAEPSLDARAVEGGAFLIDEGLGANEDPRRAESALQRPLDRERPGEASPLLVVEPFQGDDVLALGPLHRDQTGLDRLAVHQDRAAAALPRGRAPVLRGGDVELLAERGQQMGVVGLDRSGLPVDGDRHGLMRSECHLMSSGGGSTPSSHRSPR